ncbi:MAG: DUF2851 family protein [Cytophagia bacterium]|nr:MAG: DUF2851 family protein [Cytophagia bacterium]TAG43235.1 MAG: DUF2851 family protein [Cytophagia bacterium]
MYFKKNKQKMTEQFLAFLWKYQRFEKQNLRTTNGNLIEIFGTGYQNENEGADFQMVRFFWQNNEWIGTAELHIKSSDWNKHQHQQDEGYNNVVLHIVWEDDKPIFRADNSVIPTLELKNRTPNYLYQRWRSLELNENKIPCASHLSEIDELMKAQLLENAMLHRLQQKSKLVKEIWLQNELDWEETAYQLLVKSLGMKVNQAPFLRLATVLPFKIILKNRDNLLALEALLFGMAGFLEGESKDNYHQQLQKEFQFLAHKYQLNDKKLALKDWFFLRMRPANFPTLRIAQLASILHKNSTIFSLLIDENSANIAEKLNVSASVYWETHYQFGKETKNKYTKLGKNTIENLLINTVIPLKSCYYLEKDNDNGLVQVIEILEKIPAEKNKFIDLWAKNGIKVKNGYDSQALLEQYHHFCTQKRCLECVIGIKIMK